MRTVFLPSLNISYQHLWLQRCSDSSSGLHVSFYHADPKNGDSANRRGRGQAQIAQVFSEIF